MFLVEKLPTFLYNNGSFIDTNTEDIIMANVKELLKAEENGSLSFGDYSLTQKTKLDEFSFEGDVYKVKTFSLKPPRRCALILICFKDSSPDT